jgi:hypothetical protein
MFLDPTPLHQLNPTDRFSSRVTDYAQYRPSYPAAVIENPMLTCVQRLPHILGSRLGMGRQKRRLWLIGQWI